MRRTIFTAGIFLVLSVTVSHAQEKDRLYDLTTTSGGKEFNCMFAISPTKKTAEIQSLEWKGQQACQEAALYDQKTKKFHIQAQDVSFSHSDKKMAPPRQRDIAPQNYKICLDAFMKSNAADDFKKEFEVFKSAVFK